MLAYCQSKETFEWPNRFFGKQLPKVWRMYPVWTMTNGIVVKNHLSEWAHLLRRLGNKGSGKYLNHRIPLGQFSAGHEISEKHRIPTFCNR